MMVAALRQVVVVATLQLTTRRLTKIRVAAVDGCVGRYIDPNIGMTTIPALVA